MDGRGYRVRTEPLQAEQAGRLRRSLAAGQKGKGSGGAQLAQRRGVWTAWRARRHQERGRPDRIVASGVSGILFDDERELPEAVVGLLRDENRRAEMGRNAMARVRSRFDVEVVIERWHQVIDEILAGAPVDSDL